MKSPPKAEAGKKPVNDTDRLFKKKKFMQTHKCSRDDKRDIKVNIYTLIAEYLKCAILFIYFVVNSIEFQ